MSKNSIRQNYLAFTEWHNWAKTQYPSFRKKRKKQITPDFINYNNDY